MRKPLPKILCLLCSVIVLSLPFMGTVKAESLWADNSSTANLFADHKARAVGDILTIIVSENSNAVRSGQANNSKTASANLDAGVGAFKILGGGASASSKDSFKATGSISNSNNVSAKLTVQVIEIKPNGNLVVSGTQTIKQNNEEQKITVTGEVRTDDVTVDNTVLSTYVANAEIKINGNGPINAKQRQGILTQILNFIF